MDCLLDLPILAFPGYAYGLRCSVRWVEVCTASETHAVRSESQLESESERDAECEKDIMAN